MSSALNPTSVATPWPAVRESVLARDDCTCQDCRKRFARRDLHVHHLVPRARGGGDEPDNLVALCLGCHARRHPNFQVSLSRRMLERWTLRLAKALDNDGSLQALEMLPAALRLLGVERLREAQLEAIVTALSGESMLVVRPTGSGKSLCFQAGRVLLRSL